ncbi:glycoside hydrolase family 35 protein [Botryobasidium botryosum FD-172 SS1]|uniref:Beta-galactosidase n=1 Tax=Botryobasidium botryosum (strain FD-172 SS1) TaxID=930990 RepID=A0A067ML90_BOTB1|nr:glycoside hydrolase family 35 protein [Botryobasidium botryosum FD-172 SS1]
MPKAQGLNLGFESADGSAQKKGYKRAGALVAGLSLLFISACARHWSVDTPCASTSQLSDSTMRVLALATSFLSASSLWKGAACSPSGRDAELSSKGLNSNGLTDLVQWDGYSLVIKGQRVYLWSGEFHTWRLPVPDLWPDILQKVKAAGLNAISIYVHWGLSHPSRNTLDFGGYRALQPLFDAAKDAGLWVVVRPGPYINAETTAGGIPHWVTTEVHGHLRTNDTDYHDTWVPYIKAISEVTRGNQITKGGPVIAVQVENEYIQADSPGQPGKAKYMAEVEQAFRANGIVVPLTFNDAYRGNNYVKGEGSVDIYGFDSYPQSFDCSHPDVWKEVEKEYHPYHMATNPNQPLYIPEFQGGAFDPWGPIAPGYDSCRILLGPEFESVFYKHLWASNAKMVNFYMIYGGTSWGYLAFPGVYTSYDYSAAILENREIGSKYTELKRQSLFLRSTPDFYKTDVVGNSTDGTVSLSDPTVFATLLKNPDSGTRYYITRHTNSSSLENTSFTLKVGTSQGALTLPQANAGIALAGRESKLIMADFKFGASSRGLYTTASVLFSGQLAGKDTLFLHGDSKQSHEAALLLSSQSHISSSDTVKVSQIAGGYSLFNVLPGTSGVVTLWESKTQLIIYADSETAGKFWAPVIAPTPSKGKSPVEFANYWQFGSNQTVLVGGPYLVREASLSSLGTRLDLKGDLSGETMLTLIGIPKGVTGLTWNGDSIQTVQSTSENGDSESLVTTAVLRPKLEASAAAFKPPVLKNWRYADSLPEVKKGYDDSHWVVADHKSTNSPRKPYYGSSVLYGCDYGFCEGAVLWRGHFTATGKEKSVNLTINGGEAFAASVWINDQLIKTTYGNSTNNFNIIEETDEVYVFPKGSVVAGRDNVITIIQDNMGLDETQAWDADTSKSPRGIRGYKLNDGVFTQWKVQGKKGGYNQFPDKVRGIFNEGGLYGERAGWHLPQFKVNSWVSRSLSSGLPGNTAGVGFFQTEFDLNIPAGQDVPISFVFDSKYQPYRALLFVNGWLMGRRVANLGPQYKFPVHEGILNYRGKNTVVVALWVMENTGVSPELSLSIDGVYEGGVAKAPAVTNPPWIDRGPIV